MNFPEFLTAYKNASSDVRKAVETVLDLSEDNRLKTKLLIQYMEKEVKNAESKS